MTTKFKKSFSPMLICWNDIKIHLGFEDSYFVPPLVIATYCERLIFQQLVSRSWGFGKEGGPLKTEWGDLMHKWTGKGI